MERVPFFDARRPYDRYRFDLDAAFERVMRSGRLVLGAEVSSFEGELAAFEGRGHAVGVASGTDALELALRALELRPGAEVVCPDLTATATGTAIQRAGFEPVLVDVDETLTIDPAAAAEAMGPRTGAIVAVHLYGRAAAVGALLELGVPVVEDAAQSHGLRAPGVGTGALSATSFYPTKNLGGFGDGGAVLTDDAVLAERVRLLRAYAESPRYYATEPGLNSRLDELQAALLRSRLETLEGENARRSEIAATYDTALGVQSIKGVHHLYVIRDDDRDGLRASLDEAGVESLVHYPWTLSQQPAFAGARKVGRRAESERAVAEVLSLPCHAFLDADEEAHVAGVLQWLRADGRL